MRTSSGLRYRTMILLCLGMILPGRPAVIAFAGDDDRQAVARSVPRLPRDNLLVYRGPDGEPRPVRDGKGWLERRSEILAGMQAVMGRLPGSEKRCPLDVKVEDEVDQGTCVRRRITYASEPGSRVPAYLSIPKSVLREEGHRARAVLCLHPTDNVLGHGIVVGIGDRPGLRYAAELAERGFVTLAPGYPLLAGYQPDLKGLGWESGTLKAAWDNIRGLDLLDSLPFVVPGSFGAIGHSLGGHNAVYTAVHDDRIKAVVSNCGLDSFLDYYGGDEKVWRPDQGWTQARYMPRLAAYRGRLADIPFDFQELIGALAPRHVLIVAPLKDGNFRSESVDRIATAAGAAFKLLGHPERLRVEHPDCGHEFPDEMRRAAYTLFDAVLPTMEGGTRWVDAGGLDVEGKGWSDTKAFYDRLPARAETIVRAPVWDLSRDSAGLCVRFATESTTIRARWTLTSNRLAMPHMPATGVSGLDLYARGDDGRWRWLGVGQPREFPDNTATLADGLARGRREYLLYLPLYNGVSSLEIGVPEGFQVESPAPRPASARSPLVFYGTSITQGGCASRPGMVHTAILGRRLDRPVINLGFSGNGKMEPEMADLLAGLDPAVYVLDCLPNMVAEEVERRVEPFVRALRKAHPATPIVLAEDRTYGNAWLVPSQGTLSSASRAALKAAHDRLRSAGVGGLHYLPGDSQLGEDGEGTVDGSHPTDLGFSRMADAFGAILKPLLDKDLAPR